MTFQSFARKGATAVALGAFVAALPVGVHFQAGAGAVLSIAPAFAKDGNGGGDDNGGGSSSGHGGGSGSGSSGHGGGSSGGGHDDSGGGDNNGGGSGSSGRGNGGADDGGGARHREGGDDGGTEVLRGGESTATSAGRLPEGGVRAVKVERTASGIELVYSNGISEEIVNGRLEVKDAAGRTVVERPATQRDITRLDANARNSGMAPVLGRGAVRVEAADGAIEVTYATGWQEELTGGRYELKDPNSNTVVQRVATPSDIRRLTALAGG